jgi:hypothetical protein
MHTAITSNYFGSKHKKIDGRRWLFTPNSDDVGRKGKCFVGTGLGKTLALSYEYGT